MRLKERKLEEIFIATIATELQPRSCVTIVIQIVQNDGSLLAAMINAGMLALLSAGIPCHWLAASCTISYRTTGDFVLDPTMVEELEGYATVVTSYGFERTDSIVSDNLIGLTCWGFVSSEDIYFKSLSYSQEACRKVCRGICFLYHTYSCPKIYEFSQLVTKKSQTLEWV